MRKVKKPSDFEMSVEIPIRGRELAVNFEVCDIDVENDSYTDDFGTTCGDYYLAGFYLQNVKAYSSRQRKWVPVSQKLEEEINRFFEDEEGSDLIWKEICEYESSEI